MNVKIKLVRKGAVLPRKETPGSAGYDIYLPEITKVKLGRQVVPAGFALSMPESLALDCRTRAGYAAKGLMVEDKEGNKCRIDADVILGLVDSDYRNEVGVIVNVKDSLVMHKDLYFLMDKPIAQMKFCWVPQTDLVVVDELDDTERGMQGFGAANNE